MSLRDKLNQNSLPVTILAVVVLALALAYLFYQRRPANGGVIDVYFYDLKSTDPDQTKRLFKGKNNDLPPVASPSDAGTPDFSGVRAWVFTCGTCDDPSQVFISHIETYTPEYKDNLRQPPVATGGPMPMAPMAMQKGHLISRVDNIKWVEMMSTDGMQIQQSIMSKCGGEPPKPCLPGSK